MTGKAYAKYTTPQAAAYAREKMDGIEYPLGYRIGVYFYPTENRPATGATMADSSFNNVQTLVESIQKATALLHTAGISGPVAPGMGAPAGPGLDHYGNGARSDYRSSWEPRSARDYCSVELPDRKPFASRDSAIADRLFIVSQPDSFSDEILEDLFCRFGNMIGAYFMPGKKFGYVKFASSESAKRAMDRMHGAQISGNRLKVLPAEPMRQRERSSPIDDEDERPRGGKRSRFD
jgi:hypothetical protein